MKKNYSIIFILIAVISMFGCSYNKNKDYDNSISSETIKDSMIIKTDSILKNDIDKYLVAAKNEAMFPIQTVINSDKPNLIITCNKETIPENWQISEIYKLQPTIEPSTISSNFQNKLKDFIIYFGYPANNQNYQIILDYLQQEFINSPPKTSSLIFTGDIMLSRWVALRMQQKGLNYPFAKLSEYLNTGNLTIGNLESPAATTGPYTTAAGTMSFRYNPEVTPELAKAGFDIVSLANNHFGNAGLENMNFTMQNLTENKIAYIGAGENKEKSHQPLIKEINGVKYAFLGYSDSSVTPSSYAATNNKPGLNLDNIEEMTSDVKNARNNADVVIVSMHLGTEYQNTPNKKQEDFAKAAIDAGVDFIYGHHPHVIQTIDFYNGKPIFYSLGNFIFDQNFTNTQEGLIVKAKYIYNQLIGFELKSVSIKNYAQPNLEDDNRLQEILKRIQ